MFPVGPWNEGSDGTYKVAAAITQFTGGSTKYFGMPSILCSNARAPAAHW